MRWSRRSVLALCYVAMLGFLPREILDRPRIVLAVIVISTLIFIVCYWLTTYCDISLQGLRKYLWAALIVLVVLAMLDKFLPAYSTVEPVVATCLLSVFLLLGWAELRSKFETIVEGKLKAHFSVPRRTRVNVQNLEAVAPWYIEKLGFRFKNPCHPRSDYLSLSFKKDGNPIALAPPNWLRSSSYPMLFTEDIEKMREILIQRGITVGPIAPDRQGTRTFEVRDPEDNVIDVVEGWGI